MAPPRWVDAAGQPRPTYPCPRCGKPAPYDCFELATLRHLRWELFTAVQIVNWCGHAIESLVMPALEDGWAQLIPVLGEANVLQ